MAKKPTQLRKPESQNKATTVWECRCGSCGFVWTDNNNDPECPECGKTDGKCVAKTIPSSPIMPQDENVREPARRQNRAAPTSSITDDPASFICALAHPLLRIPSSRLGELLQVHLPQRLRLTQALGQ